jgi:hypothetical protein
MEEILASIRRIIADDDDSKSAPRSPEPAKARAPTFYRLAAFVAGVAGKRGTQRDRPGYRRRGHGGTISGIFEHLIAPYYTVP